MCDSSVYVEREHLHFKTSINLQEGGLDATVLAPQQRYSDRFQAHRSKPTVEALNPFSLAQLKLCFFILTTGTALSLMTLVAEVAMRRE